MSAVAYRSLSCACPGAGDILRSRERLRTCWTLPTRRSEEGVTHDVITTRGAEYEKAPVRQYRGSRKASN